MDEQPITAEDLIAMGYTFKPVPVYEAGQKQASRIQYQLYDPEGNAVMVTNNRPCIQAQMVDLPTTET